MPQVSERGELMPASPIRRLVPLANQAKQRGTKVYHLNIGQPDVPTPREGLDALKHIDRNVLEYSPSDGLLSLRQKLKGYYKRFNIDVDVDDIIVTTGGSEAVLFAFMACLDPGDEIIVPEPAYANYMAFAISAGAKIVTVPSTIDEGFALPSFRRPYTISTARFAPKQKPAVLATFIFTGPPPCLPLPGMAAPAPLRSPPSAPLSPS